MKKLLMLILAFLFLSSTAFANDGYISSHHREDSTHVRPHYHSSEYKQNLEYIVAAEFIKQERIVPEKLQAIGFTKYTLIHYYCLGNTEYYAFSDWRTEERGDVITWVVVGGEVKDWFKEKTGGNEGADI